MDLATNLDNEITRRERVFERRLRKVGDRALVEDYMAIKSLHSCIRVINGADGVGVLTGETKPDLPPRPDGFVLADAVRHEISLLNGKRFRASEILRALQNRFPESFTKHCRQTVSATVTNMVNNSELERERVGARKVFYRSR